MTEYEQINHDIKSRDFVSAFSALMSRNDEMSTQTLGKLMYRVLNDELDRSFAISIAKEILKESEK